MTNSKSNKKQHYKSDGFFEAFRELGNQTSKSAKDAVASVMDDSINQISGRVPTNQPPSGELHPNRSDSLQKEALIRQEQTRKKERAHFEKIRRKEKLVFSRKEEELKAQIQTIKTELKKIIEEAGEIAHEVDVAIEQTVAEPGTYHLNFFDKLRQILVLLRKKISSSKTWMHTVNSRSKRRSFYWGQVKKSGTKFMLSQERYMATQAG